MKTNILTIPDIKNIFAEMFINKTDKVTKISDNSVLNAIAYSDAKINQRSMKDTALVEAQAFPEFAYGYDLDIVANRYGIPARYGALGSSTFLRIVGEPGTLYGWDELNGEEDLGKNIFQATNGTRFRLTHSFVIGNLGYEYVRVISETTGEITNVEANTITRMTGSVLHGIHRYCINEFRAMGGRDIEDDSSLRSRISQTFNLMATDTLGRLEQVLIALNPNVLNVKKIGKNTQGETLINIHTQNGSLLSNDELSLFQDNVKRFLSISDVGEDYISTVKFQNGYWEYIDIEFRVELFGDVNIDDWRRNVQIQLAQYFDWRDWNYNKSVIWSELFYIVRQQPGTRFLPDQYFRPRADIIVKNPYLPRIRGFKIFGLNGNILSDTAGALNPVFYQNIINTDYQHVVLSNL